MRIGLFSDTFPPDLNGVANSTRILFQELKKHGHDVYVIATGNWYEPETGWDEAHEILRLPGIEAKKLYGYVITSPFHLQAMSEIRELHLDVIHAQTEFGVGILARICAKQMDIPLVSTYHTTYEDYTHYANFLNLDTIDSVAKIAIGRLSKLYGDSSVRVIAPSEKTKRLLEKYKVSTDIKVVPTGLPLDQFNPVPQGKEDRQMIRTRYEIAPDETLFIYVGRIAEEKALDLVIDGFYQAVQSGCQSKLLIVGGGPDEEKLKQMVLNYGCTDRILFAGKQPADTIPAFYHAADCFISASLSETQGMTFIEALASGLPLLARQDEVLDEILDEGETGWFFSDASTLAKRIMQVESLDDQTIVSVRKNCIGKVKPYSSETFYQEVISVYRDAIEEYGQMSFVEDVRVRGEFVHLYLKSLQNENTRLVMTLDDYYYAGIRKGGKLSRQKIKELQENEQRVKAYQGALRRISVKDRSRKEIYDWIVSHTECRPSEIDEILGKLEEKGYLNDERYAEESVTRMRYALLGERSIERDLKKKGISSEIIESVIHGSADEEKEQARRYAERIKNSIRGESVKMKKKKLAVRLMNRGYDAELAQEVIALIDFSEDEMNEVNALRKCAVRARKRYERKYADSRLRNMVFRYCLAQGYPGEDIYAILDEMEWEYDKNQRL